MSFRGNDMQFPYLKMTSEEMVSATDNFSDKKLIGKGGFGHVYLGQLTLQNGYNVLVAIKVLIRAYGQGVAEFWKEITAIDGYNHQNLVSLVGFFAELGKEFLVYEYECHRSLDLHLSSTSLSWHQRLCICIDAARGIECLHDHAVVHRDIKSANILLDKNWMAKISDFGLSTRAPDNYRSTFLINQIAGTRGYCDPYYAQTGYLSKQSDVYSLGVVLFEILCGRLCVLDTTDIGTYLTTLVQTHYKEKKLDTVILDCLKEQISPKCLQWFSKVAYQCLSKDPKERPSMTKLRRQLVIALIYQEGFESEKKRKMKGDGELDSNSDAYWETKLPTDLELIINMLAIPPAIYTIKKELFCFLHKGILFDEESKFFWINDDAKICLSTSVTRFVDINQHKFLKFESQIGSRFPLGAKSLSQEFNHIKCHIDANMLSVGTVYEANLVFRYHEQPIADVERLQLITIKWRTQEISVCSTHAAELTRDNWYVITLWKFIHHGPNSGFDITLEELSYEKPSVSSLGLLIQGIEFQPTDMNEDIEGFESFSITDEEDKDDNDDAYWETRLPNDYHRYIGMSEKPLDYTTKKDLYLLFCHGFLGDNGQLWFYLCKTTGKMCSMLRAIDILHRVADYVGLLHRPYLPEARFDKVIQLEDAEWFRFEYRLRSPMFSPEYIYACYLVFKFEEDHAQPNDTFLFKAECMLDDISQGIIFAYLISSPVNIPVIEAHSDYGLQGLVMPKGVPYNRIYERKDGWMEVMLCKRLPQLENDMSLTLNIWEIKDAILSGMVLQGFEFRPCV